MILVLILLLLFISILSHLYYLFSYIKTRLDKYFRRFLNTAVFNLFLSGTSVIIAIFKPEEIRKIEGPMVIWFISGLLLILTLAFQVTIFIRVYRRVQLPDNYHYNFFGKKVYHPSVLKSMEVVLFFISLPLFLIGGAYFIARLIRSFI